MFSDFASQYGAASRNGMKRSECKGRASLAGESRVRRLANVGLQDLTLNLLNLDLKSSSATPNSNARFKERGAFISSWQIERLTNQRVEIITP